MSGGMRVLRGESRRELLARCRRHPLYRAVRPGRMTLAALEAVLRLQMASAPMPLDRLWPDAAAHRARLERAAAALAVEELVNGDVCHRRGSIAQG